MAKKLSAKNYENLTEQEKQEYRENLEKASKQNMIKSRIIAVCIAILVLFALFLAVRVAWVRFACIEIENDEVTIVRNYTLLGGDMKLPDEMFGHPVTAIGYNAFKGSNIKSVQIPDSVTFIDGCAFIECDSLENAVIPDSVTKMGNFVFGGCDALESVYLSRSLTEIPDGTFDKCRKLKFVSFSDSITYIGSHSFNECEALESFVIPDTVTEMGSNAFTSCLGLKEVSIGSGLADIPFGAFMACGLAEIVIPDNIKTIDETAFQGSALTVRAPHESEYYGLAQSPEGLTWIIEE